MTTSKTSLWLTAILLVTGIVAIVKADPCGMVPPIWTGNVSPISRIGLQKTYVFHKDGVETFVIRPGFTGNVDNFGMLIPFPNPPEIRKVADNIFEQVANAVDPPEVVVDLRIRRMMRRGALAAPMAATAEADSLSFMAKNEIKVLKEEAVGMYEVAVLQAGSAFALKKWMDKNGYQYPDGMDKVTNEYVEQKWCFVAVKTKVGQQKGVEPRPGQRKVQAQLPQGSVFDGNVQGMGFRFKSEELVVPMRLSAFNGGDLRNIVYLLTDGPRKIRAIPEEYVVRQIKGEQLYNNVTQPLPLRIIGGTEKDIPAYRRNQLPEQRNPEPKNGVARDLFAADLLAVSSGNLSLQHEEEEKELLRIGEHFGLRGADVDKENGEALAKTRKKIVAGGLEMIKDMTLTVVDGDFPREVIANQNLTFATYNMPQVRNNETNYDAKQFGPGSKKEGVLKVGKVDWQQIEQQIASDHRNTKIGLHAIIVTCIFGMVGMIAYRRPQLFLVLIAASLTMSPMIVYSAPTEDAKALVKKLADSDSVTQTLDEIYEYSKTSEENREKMIELLLDIAKEDESLPKRGWAIAALGQIGGQDVDEYLLDIHADTRHEKIVRTWAAAARVSMTRTLNGLIEKANLIREFPALGRPIGMRIVEKTAGDKKVDVEKVVTISHKIPQLQQALAQTVLAFGPEKLVEVMITAKDQNTRRTAAGYVAAMARDGQGEEIAKLVSDSLKFDKTADTVPWANGPLFIPGIQWPKESAIELVGNLIRWNVWCDVQGMSDEQRQIHNNIRSLGLANSAGYTSPGWNNVDCVAWLKAWKEAVGADEVKKILDEQNVAKGKYLGALR